ncbi:MAG: LLM class flavin-dependent oxidoreductase [Thermomicrobiales bacterium]|nr:LLM class flavin-dependent oxidoreductase [Thermomicrobiales bacterium]
MEHGTTAHPWIASIRDRVTFGLQVVARAGEPEPGKKIVAAARVADELGFEALYLGDHPAWSPEPWTHFAAMAMVTTRIRLGPMVAASPYRTPLMTARLASDIDHLSDGRVLLGLGIGWNAADYGLGTNEFDRMGLPYPSTTERQAAVEEAIALIRGLWGPELFSFEGTHYRARDARVPAPVQQPGPPLILAGGGERVTLRQVARLADVANFGPGPAGGVDTPEIARRKHEVLKRHCEEAGRPYEDILRSLFSHWVMVAPDEAALAAKVRRYFPDGLDDFWGKYLIAGTPARIVELFQRYVDAGIQHFDCQVLDPEDIETFSLLIQEVLPALNS